MTGEKDLDQLKKEAAAKAKAAALAKMKAKEQGEAPPEVSEAPKAEEMDVAKQKAAAAAKAKAAALAKMKAKEQSEALPGVSDAPKAEEMDIAKQKAAAAAKAKAAAAAKAKAAALAKQAGDEGGSAPASDDEKAKAIAAAKAKAAAAAKAKAAAAAKAGGESVGDDEKAKAIAAAKAKAAAAAAAKAKAGGATAKAEPAEEMKPSPNQPILDKYVKAIEENLGAEVLEDSYINNLSKDVPTLVAKKEAYFKLAEFLKYNEQLGFDYLSELHGTDFVTHMEVYVHLFSYKNNQSVALKVKLDRDEPEVDSLVSLWLGANWPECEAYDLLGIKFNNHPSLHRIMLGEDWVGHPLRKDYEPYDVEV